MTSQLNIRLVSAEQVLTALFTKETRPSLRWFRSITKQRLIPHFKIGRFVRFDIAQVRAALDRNCLVHGLGLEQ